MQCQLQLAWPFVYPFVLIYLHVICFAQDPCCSPSLACSLCMPAWLAGWLIFLCFFCSWIFPVLFPSALRLYGSRLSARMPVTYGCYVHYQYALYGASCRFIFCQRFSPTFECGYHKLVVLVAGLETVQYPWIYECRECPIIYGFSCAFKVTCKYFSLQKSGTLWKINSND